MKMKKLLGLGDLKIVRANNQSYGRWIPPSEMKEVLDMVGDAEYLLYSVFRTYPFNDSNEITDAFITKLLNWNEQKVQKKRLTLERLNLLRIVRYGSKTDGVTKVFVGRDVLALFDAGLPSDILESKALNKLKKEFNIKTSQDLVDNALILSAAFEKNPEKYLTK